MRLGGHQPDYLPYGGFFARMLMVDTFVIVDHVQFEKKSFQSRNRVAGPAGETLLSVPVRTHGRFTQAIVDVEISEPNGRWRTKHWRTLQQCYRSSPGFTRHAPYFEQLYRTPWHRLVDLNLAIIDYLCRCFGITTPRVRSGGLGLTGRGTTMLVQMCQVCGADEYVSGPGGLSYVNDALLESAGVRSYYARHGRVPYRRNGRPFVADLSAVDLLFHADVNAGAILRASVAGPPVPRRELAEVGP
ncbi:WbqC family protein [Micromonospora sp. NPDC005652]|uniref:WbqC family protein n=1 Tax=Micromonospora sp. NPDC005652 TaxID=3157046 RepID=UPI0033F0BAF3